jgi:hypothetical protein
MPFLELFDETLDINSTENYELAVQISNDGFAFSLLDTIRNKYVLLRSSEPEENKHFTADTISGLIAKDDFLNRRYMKVNVVMPTPKFTLIPAPLFDPGKKEEYFSLNYNREDSEIILSNKLSDPDAYIVFSVPASLYGISQNLWPATSVLHHTKPLLNQLSHNCKTSSGFYVNVHIEKEFFNVIVYEHGSLKFSNTFSYRNVSDILYYVLNVFRTLGITHDEPLHLSGLTDMYDGIWSGFAMYIRNLKLTEPAGSFTFSYVFNDLGLHRFINLFNLTNCG